MIAMDGKRALLIGTMGPEHGREPRSRVRGSRRKLAIALVMFATAALLGSAASNALAASPWWHLTSGSRPTYIQPGSARNEIQRVAVSGQAGEVFTLADLTTRQIENGEFYKDAAEEEPLFAEFPVEAEASVVQEGLEQVYGKGSVSVTGGPGDEGGTKPYLVEFVGGLADSSVRVINTELSRVSVTVTETAAGRPDGQIVVFAENVGDSAVNGSKTPATIEDVLPPGLRAVSVTGTRPAPGIAINARPSIPCDLGTLSCEMTGLLEPYDAVEMLVSVVVLPGAASHEENEVRASGGAAKAAVIARPLTISTAETPFGVENYGIALEEEGGAPATQAGSHPFQLTTSFSLNQTARAQPAALVKDASFKLPAGLVGNVTRFPKCSNADFFTKLRSVENRCPERTAVGVAQVVINEPATGLDEVTVPIFNLEPQFGEPARFGFYAVTGNTPVSLDTSVRTGDDYGVTVSVHNVTQTAALMSSNTTFWGIPGDPRHDGERGWGCLFAERGETEHSTCEASEESQPPPLLSLPTSCADSLQTSIEVDSWSEPGITQTVPGSPTEAMDGCNRLQFAPSVIVTPEHQTASTATGMSVDVHVPQDGIDNAVGLSPSAVKDIKVTLPDGVTLNPAAAGGLLSCSTEAIGYLPGTSTAPSVLHFTPTAGDPFCPEAAKVGTATVTTPLLAQPLHGSVYLATQNANPFGSLVAIYIFVEDPVSGSVVKLAGDVSLDAETGRITAVFQNNPQLPFEDAVVHFFGGERAPLVTPARCGTYTTFAVISPWSGTAPVPSQSSFEVNAGRNGTPCPGALPFAPSLDAGTTEVQAGSFSPLNTTIAREDGDQAIQAVQLRTPPGLSGVLAGVPLCEGAQADAGTCSAASLIGHTEVTVGVGGRPYEVTGGNVFLTGGYHGAPFGLSIVTPAKAGPFDLGIVVVRAKIEVDPHTAELTITTDAVPHILDGIPLDIRRIDVSVDRGSFIFNPTNCGPLKFTSTIAGLEGGTVNPTVPFEAVNCATLPFGPKFTVSTAGRTTKAVGASLLVKLSYPSGAFGHQANIASVKVQLPKQLPSRLTTLQKACVAAVFDANPANCPTASNVGQARILTPLLPVPLTGPAFLVSHGGAAFPDLTLVLQGYGITIDLVGNTAIKNGVTTSTFKATPDVPFSSFELKLPQGDHSVLAANGDLCKTKLLMPTSFVAQNGATLDQVTKIGVTGCGKALTRVQKLKRALRACRKQAGRRRRALCQSHARRRYGNQARRVGRKPGRPK